MKIINITNMEEALHLFNENLKKSTLLSPYRVLDFEPESSIISNVPPQLYENRELQKYIPPSTDTHYNSNHLINLIQDSLNFFHQNPQIMELNCEDGKCFHLNDCQRNSLAVFTILHYLVRDNALPITSEVCICVGYIVNKISPGALLGNAVVNFDGLFVHDWHIWNKINDFIIDISVNKNGNNFQLGTKNIMWEKAEDHVFKNPPNNLTYYGTDFSHLNEFFNYVADLIK